MFVRITTLQHWKSEHDAASCEDVVQADPAQGLFALADGAGTTLFSQVWARVLVEQFLQVPLLSTDPFEVEWWVRRAQEHCRQQMPPLRTPSWNVVQKLRAQGSYATLAGLRVHDCDARSLSLEFLAIGDSCLFIHKAGDRHIQTAPYTSSAEFDAAPVCLPSLPTLFERTFHRIQSYQYTIAPGDKVLLATDAVARWIISAGKGRCSDSAQSFQLVAEQTPESWPTFIENCRERGEMFDDDSTALSLSFTMDACADTHEPGSIREHRPEIRLGRKQAFVQALQEQNKELQAILYGDGTDLTLEGVSFSLQAQDEARQVADALRVVLGELRKQINSSTLVHHRRRIWAQYAALLASEACAANLRQTLTSLGVLPLPTADLALASAARTSPEEILPARQENPVLQQAGAWPILAQTSGPTHESTFTIQHSIQASLASRSIERMALSYTQLSHDVSFLTPVELEQLRLSYNFNSAFEAANDEELFNVYLQMVQSGHLSAFELNGYENERIEIIAHRKNWRRL